MMRSVASFMLRVRALRLEVSSLMSIRISSFSCIMVCLVVVVWEGDAQGVFAGAGEFGEGAGEVAEAADGKGEGHLRFQGDVTAEGYQNDRVLTDGPGEVEHGVDFGELTP